MILKTLVDSLRLVQALDLAGMGFFTMSIKSILCALRLYPANVFRWVENIAKNSLCPCLLLVGLITAIVPVVSWAQETAAEVLQMQCHRCHDLTGPAPRTLHELIHRKGPDLFYAGNKYRKDWLQSWLQKPERIRPAGMYYGDHIKTTAKGDVIDVSTLKPHPVLDAKTANAVVSLLMKLTANDDLINKGEYHPGKISLSMGELMFDKFKGCLACHQIEPGYGGVSGPEVFTVAARLQADFMMSYMRNPQAWDPRIFMPNKHLKDRDLQKFVHYFRALSQEDFE